VIDAGAYIRGFVQARQKLNDGSGKTTHLEKIDGGSIAIIIEKFHTEAEMWDYSKIGKLPITN
jgi:hypothetical protein